MKKLSVLLIISILPFINYSQVTILQENFDATTMPPNGWTIDNQATNWVHSNTVLAGGANQGELLLASTPQYFDTTYFISPLIDLSGTNNVSLEFFHFVNYNTSIPLSGKIGVATRSGNGVWSSVYEYDITASLPSQLKNISINNADANAPDFQFSFYFKGISDVAEWYIDDIHLFSSNNNDVSCLNVLGKSIYPPNTAYTPEATIKNVGLNTVSFDVTCTIFDENNAQVYTDVQTISNLNSTATNTVTFTSFNLANSNSYYRVEVTTNLPNDSDLTNNLASKIIYTYTTPRDQVVAEMATGTWCYTCPGGAMGVDDLLTNGKDVAVIEYHGNDDYSTTTSENRINYYNFAGFPSVIFDGKGLHEGGDPTNSLYTNYLPLYDSAKVENTGITIDFNATLSNDTYRLHIDINKVGPVMDTNTVIYMVLTESHINEVWQTQNELNHVERLSLPNGNGQDIELVNQSSVSTYFDFQLDNSWDINNLEVIVFVQNKDNKEVLNTHKGLLVDVLGINDVKTNTLSIYPNPFTNQLTFNVDSDTNLNDVSLFNILGQNVTQLVSFKQNVNSISINTEHLPKGTYILKYKHSTKKVVKL